MSSGLELFAGLKWIAVQNDAGVEIPAFALLRITGRATTGEFKVAQPNADSMTGCLVNGPMPIPVTVGAVPGCGQALAEPFFNILYDTADGTPAVGDTWGPGNASWKLRKNKTGYKTIAVGDGVKVWAIAAAGAGGTQSHYYCVASGSVGSVASAVFSFDSPSGGTEVLSFSLSINPGSHFSIVGNRLRVGSAANYLVTMESGITVGSKTMTTWMVILRKNGSDVADFKNADLEDFTNYGATADDSQSRRSISRIMALAANDDLSASFWQWNTPGSNSGQADVKLSLLSCDHF